VKFSEIVQRDAMTAATWFTGPASGPALAYRDRRVLIEKYTKARETLEEVKAQADAMSAQYDEIMALAVKHGLIPPQAT
jgi:hypothetical protein